MSGEALLPGLADALQVAEQMEQQAVLSKAFAGSQTQMPIAMTPDASRAVGELIRTLAECAQIHHMRALKAEQALADAMALANELKRATLPALFMFRFAQLSKRTNDT